MTSYVPRWLGLSAGAAAAAFGTGEFLRVVLTGVNGGWPLLFVPGGLLLAFTLGASAALWTVGTRGHGPLRLERRHEGVTAAWRAGGWRVSLGLAHGLLQALMAGWVVWSAWEAAASPTRMDTRILFGTCGFAAVVLCVAWGVAAAHILRGRDYELEANADGLSLAVDGQVPTVFGWPTLTVRADADELTFDDGGSSWIVRCLPGAARDEMLEVLRTRAGTPDDRLDVAAPTTLQAMVEGR